MSDKDFYGDMTRNEVQLDLDKFTEILQNNNELREAVLKLQSGDKGNPYIKWVHLARTIDAYRIFPRLFFGTYIILLLKSVVWFMALAAPTPAQAGLIATITGVGAAWFSSYVNSGWNGTRAIIQREKNEQ